MELDVISATPKSMSRLKKGGNLRTLHSKPGQCERRDGSGRRGRDGVRGGEVGVICSRR